MKNFLVAMAGLGAVVASAPASAADLAAKPRPYTKAPPIVAATIYDWSGFYIGANAGGGASRDCWNLVSNAGVAVNPAMNREGCTSASGALVGGQIGYRFQMANWVFGVEAQGDWADFKGTRINQILPGVSDRTQVNAFGLFTGQVGYAFNNVLAYVKGGGAVVGDKYNTFTTATNVVLDQANTTRWGGTVGAGLEYGFAPNWSVGVEYDHIFLGNKNLNFTTVGGAAAMTHNITQDVDLGMVRVNYKFGPSFMKF
ncbi:MAG: porin family protein [Bradyrhizobium sp.]|uniref:outer membrane protein n=1 Tax=Bradyrhizobium sp. TaxID=376 RepID=UPI001DC2C69F|nr:outer membrane beta-barrel protein [Bradyrhizobium sp.]MBV9564019.1 porin family protein [Bradyrhizobium sp.]